VAPDDLTEVNVVALTPADMVPAQHELIAWCARKLVALRDEVDELQLHHTLAIENGWRTSVVESSLSRARRRIEYYEKIARALEAGYLLVPNMPVDVLAIRVDRRKPVRKTTGSEWSAGRVRVESLPAGAGRYVDEEAFTRSFQLTEQNYKGEPVKVTKYQPAEFDEVDFPVALTKPVVLERVAQAMALRVFDTIGLVQNGGRKGDPIYVGQIMDPRRGDRRATFFLAWWVDTRAL
jgi:hypothetical protein